MGTSQGRDGLWRDLGRQRPGSGMRGPQTWTQTSDQVTLIQLTPHYLYPPQQHTTLPTLPLRPLPRSLPLHPLSQIAMLTPTEEAIADIKSATAGFDFIFSNELGKAEDLFKSSDSALHLLGSGACAFLQAALSLEVRTCLLDTALEVV